MMLELKPPLSVQILFHNGYHRREKIFRSFFIDRSNNDLLVHLAHKKQNWFWQMTTENRKLCCRFY